jgi:hypothetical protein
MIDMIDEFPKPGHGIALSPTKSLKFHFKNLALIAL